MTGSQRERVGLVHAAAAGLLAGGAVGLVAALLTPTLRHLAGVGDRSLINGLSVVGLSVGAWLLGGLLYAWLAGRVQRPALVVAGVMAALAALAAAAIYAGVGPSPLAPYPVRCPSLAVPLLALVALGGAAVFVPAVRRTALLPRAAVLALVLAVVAGGVVYASDRQGSVHYTLTTANASNAGVSVAPASSPAAQTGPASGATPAAAGTPAASAAPAGVLHFTVASPSEAAYTVREKLAKLPAPSDAIGKTQAITGDIWLTPTGLAPGKTSTISVDLRTLTSDAPRRDSFLHTNSLQSDTYPMATFTVDSVTGFPASYTPGTPVQVTVAGQFSVHGVQKPLSWTGSATYNGAQLEAVLSTQFDMADFNITPPNISVAQAQSGVKLDLHLYAAQQPA